MTAGRVRDGLIALYDFAEGEGTSVTDIAGVTDGMSLEIEDPSAVAWKSGGLRFNEPTVARTSEPPDGFYEAVEDSQEFSVDAWIEPAAAEQHGPARIVTLSKDTKHANFMLGHGTHDGPGRLLEARLHQRNSEMDPLRTPAGEVSDRLLHVALTRSSDGVVTLYLDGEMSAQSRMADSLEEWDTSYRLAIGDELSGDRAWLGTYHLLGLYTEALSADEVRANFAAGHSVPSTDGRDRETTSSASPSARGGPASDTCSTGEASELSHHGITWTFDDAYECGHYANGDHWVVGPVTIVEIDPPSTGEHGWNGAMVNPSPQDDDRIGYGNIRANTYYPDLNVALDVSDDNPLRVQPDSSLVSTISVGDPDARPGIDTAAVLTVVDESPAPSSFRPPYTGQNKSHQFTTQDLRYELLPQLDPVPGTPDVEALADEFEQVWLDHVPGWKGRKIHPAASMPDYGRDLTALLGQGYLGLMLDLPEEEKEDLLINLVQIGIDFYGLVEEGMSWDPDGGHASGRKWPILFAGKMLDDTDMVAIGERDDVLFGEDAQTFYVTEEDVARGVGYTQDDLGLPEWGIRHRTDPDRDDSDWEASYRRSSTANAWGGQVLAARIMELQDAWNHDPLFDYVDLYVEREDPGAWERFWDQPFTENMWEAYRSQY